MRAAKAFTNKIESITPSGYAGFIDLIITVKEPKIFKRQATELKN